MNGAISNSVQDVVVTAMQAWLAEHPIVSWIIAHPLWTIALLVFAIFCFWSLLGAMAQLTQQVWLALLQAPLRIIQLLSRSVLQSFKRADVFSGVKPDRQPDIQERLPKILSRLETLRQEQDALIREMQSMLISKN